MIEWNYIGETSKGERNMNNMNSKLIMEPFNALFFGIFAALIILLVIVSLLLRKKDIKVRETVIVAASLVTLAGFFVYKYFLSIDADFDAIRAAMGMGGFICSFLISLWGYGAMFGFSFVCYACSLLLAVRFFCFVKRGVRI